MVRWKALDALSHQLELCAVGAETRVVVVIDPVLDIDQMAHIRVAVARSGAMAIEVHVSPDQSADNEPLAAAIDAAGLIITTGAHHTIDCRRTASLHVHAIAPEMFAPHANLRRRTNSVVDALGSAAMLTMTDANGTNLTVALTNGATTFDHGRLGDDHNHACFPAGWVKVVPAAATVHGQLVIMPGDANLGARRLITSPVVLELVDDHVSAIQGDSPDADTVRALLEHPDEPSAYGIAGLSIGLNPGPIKAGPFDDRLLDPVVGRILAGVVNISFGENLTADRPCSQTIAIGLPGRSVLLDALPIILDGQLQGDIAPDVYELG